MNVISLFTDGRLCRFWFCAALAILAFPSAAGAAGNKPLPKFGRVRQAVQQHFAALADYQQGDLIARSEVEPLLRRLDKLGWPVENQKAILDRVLPDEHFLVVQLHTRHGKALMRKVYDYPLVYDRMDRISQETGGTRLLRDLPQMPNADKAVPHMVEFLPKVGSGRRRTVEDYDKPTGRIYTEQSLLAELQRSHELAEQKAKKSG